MEPLCLVINGPSAAGKSTLTTAIQDRAEIPLLRFGLDELFRMVPDHWGGGLPGARHSDLGFRYEDVDGHDGMRRIRSGPDGMLMLGAMNAAGKRRRPLRSSSSGRTTANSRTGSACTGTRRPALGMAGRVPPGDRERPRFSI